MTLAVTKTVRLGDLDHDPVIMAMPGQEARLAHLDDLKGSIPAKGILQNLNVRVDADGVRYLVTAGNRRLATLRWLRDTGGTILGEPVTDELPVPVILREGTDDDAKERAVHENVQRAALTPVAEALQYADLAKRASNKEIAAQLGVSEKRVAQRLKLASLHPDVLAALDRGEITIAAAEAFTVESDPEKQAKYLRKADGNSWKLSTSEIRKALVRKLVPGTADITKLVGREAYLAAGGEIVEDPFDGAEYWLDSGLLHELAEKHWAGQVAAWEAEGWAFVVEAKAYGQYFYPHNMVTPAEVPLDDATVAERAGLVARLVQLIGEYEIDPYAIDDATDGAVQSDELVANASDEVLPDPPDEIVAEVSAATARLYAIGAASKTFTAEQKAGSGVVYWLDGSRLPVRGFIDPKRATPPKEEAKKLPRERAPSLAELDWDLRHSLQDALFAALRERAAADPLFGLQILVAKLHVSAVHGAAHDVPLALDVARGQRIDGQPERGKSFGGALNWAKQQDVSTLAEAAGQLVGRLLAPPHYGGGEEATAALVRLLRPDLAAHFDAAAYCKALTAPQLELVWRELSDAKPPAPKELAKRVAEDIREKGWLPPQLRTPDYKGPSGKASKSRKKKSAAEDVDDVPAIAAE